MAARQSVNSVDLLPPSALVLAPAGHHQYLETMNVVETAAATP